MSGLTIETGESTSVGRRRDHNEDARLVLGPSETSQRVVCVVADGMGGHLAGEIASGLAIETLERELNGSPSDASPNQLRQAVERANSVIWAEAQANPEKRGMGTTVVCAVIDGGRANIANVGDSPAYLVTNGSVRQLTHDHAWVAEQVAMGTITPAEAEKHPYRHVLTRCLGADSGVDVEVYPPIDLVVGDVLVLCSDGLTEHVKADEIGLVVSASDDPDMVARELVELANERGGVDNITVVVARVRE